MTPYGVTDVRYRFEVLEQDVEAVSRLVSATGFFSPEEAALAAELVEERLAHGEASGYLFLFAERDQALVGYTCYGAIPATVASYDLYWIAVDPRFQEQGIGRRLLKDTEAAIERAGGRRIYVETSARGQYAPTRRFYRATGYTLDAHLPDFYAPGEAKCIYVKSLASR